MCSRQWISAGSHASASGSWGAHPLQRCEGNACAWGALLAVMQYRSPWGEARIGRILEDLDSLTALVAFEHWSERPPCHPWLHSIAQLAGSRWFGMPWLSLAGVATNQPGCSRQSGPMALPGNAMPSRPPSQRRAPPPALQRRGR